MFKHPKPNPNFDYIGMHFYSLTWCCHARQRPFTQQDRVDLVRQQILRACCETKFEVFVDCYMPDHLHQLIHGSALTSDAKRFIRSSKQYSGFHFKKSFGESVWQRYGHDDIAWNNEDVKRIAQYIIENPVRAHLVEKAADYPYIGSQIFTREELFRWAYS